MLPYSAISTSSSPFVVVGEPISCSFSRQTNKLTEHWQSSSPSYCTIRTSASNAGNFGNPQQRPHQRQRTNQLRYHALTLASSVVGTTQLLPGGGAAVLLLFGQLVATQHCIILFTSLKRRSRSLTRSHGANW